jgi:hypothetical protein
MDAALVGHLDAKTALDSACWDINGKSVGLPVVLERLLGQTLLLRPLCIWPDRSSAYRAIHIGSVETWLP